MSYKPKPCESFKNQILKGNVSKCLSGNAQSGATLLEVSNKIDENKITCIF